MQYEAIRASTLTTEMILQWSRFRQQNPVYQSPCFSPLFIQALARYRDDVYAAVLKRDGQIQGFFPFRKGKNAIAGPIEMCDYQGIVAAPGIQVQAAEMLKALGLKAWDFDHLVTDDPGLTARAHCLRRTNSYWINLSKGFPDYEIFLSRHRSRWPAILRKARKIEREIGPVRFDLRSEDRSALRTLLSWKARKFSQVSEYPAWIIDSIEECYKTQTDDFQGLLSVLYAGGELAAAHFGVISGRILHYWFPAYNPAMQAYSPGSLLLYYLARHAGEMGIKAIDLGPGGEPYKKIFANAANAVCSGTIENLSWVTVGRSIARTVSTGIRRQAFIRNLVRGIRKIYLTASRAETG